MSKPNPARYRTTNWSDFDAAFSKRGALLIRLYKEMIWHAPHEGRTVRPPVLSNAAIQFCLSIKVIFRLPFGQTAMMVASLLRLAGLGRSVPDHSTPCRRQKTLQAQIPYRRADGPLNLLVDGAGGWRRWMVPGSSFSAMASGKPASIACRGDGEPCRVIAPSVNGERRKVHLAMDTATSDIRAVEFTRKVPAAPEASLFQSVIVR